jgi:hypothetical protein
MVLIFTGQHKIAWDVGSQYSDSVSLAVQCSMLVKMYIVLQGLRDGQTQWQFEAGYFIMEYWKEEE